MGTKTTKKRAKLGRKRINLSDPDTLKKIKHLAGLGLSDKAISTSLGISARTLARRKKDSVIFGDLTDLRFLDPINVIVGLKAKGQAKKDYSGFVINS